MFFNTYLLPSPPDAEQGGSDNSSVSTEATADVSGSSEASQSSSESMEVNEHDSSFDSVFNEASKMEGYDSGDFAPDDASQDDKSDTSELDHDVEEKTYKEMLEELKSDGESKDDESEQSDPDADDVEPEKFTLKHNGEIEQYGKDETIELAQKGLDYTKKTQVLADERKVFEEQKSKFDEDLKLRTDELEKSYNEHKTIINDYYKLEHTLHKLADQDPDTFDIVDAIFKEVEKESNSPAVRMANSRMDKLEAENKALKDMIESGNIKEQSELISKGYFKDLETIEKQYAPVMANLGIKLDKEAVKNAWINGEQSNKTVEDAFWETHGKAIAKIHESKRKIKNIENKKAINGMRSGVGKKSLSQSGNDVDLSGMSWNEIQKHYATAL